MEQPKLSALFGHSSAATPELAQILGVDLATAANPDLELAIFAMNAQSGLDQNTIDLWHSFDDLLTPRILLITGLTEGELDFDDAVLIARRVLDEVATPYLVLHDDAGNPAGLISLFDNQIIDYSNDKRYPAEPEHITLVSEFREEFLNQLEAAGDNGFESGIYFPAIPIVPPKIGVDLAKSYIERIKNSPSAGD
ncbi:MAG: hypothetical protein RL301_115 [Actinomycetota bacterium]|jgi:hypothetical protein